MLTTFILFSLSWFLNFNSLNPLIWLLISIPLLLLSKLSYSLNHSLIVLLCLEALSLFLFSMMILTLVQGSLFLLIFLFMVLAVCEASLGLCLLVRLSRSTGSDLIPLCIFKLKKLKTFKVFNATQNFYLV